FVLACRGKRTVNGEIVSTGNHELLRGETRDHFVTGFGDDNLLFDSCGAPSILRRPERLESKYHSRFDFVGMFQRDQAADDGLFPNRESDAVAELQRKGRFFIWKPKL